ncbi:OsmC family protein [Camelliibacillus cellulosilyticus]|uniref:OsmC family protein n=1 Tax=Camelliibacillus cellulosilyticus TaxID=2174486 RepID=A0ABV9GKS2_9BACL
MDFQIIENGILAHAEHGDLKIASKGQNGYRPYELLVSSIVGCSGATLRKILEKMRLPFTELKISTLEKRNPDEANRVEEIKIKFMIFGEDLPESKIKKAIELTRKNCGMIQSVKDSIRIHESYELRQG